MMYVLLALYSLFVLLCLKTTNQSVNQSIDVVSVLQTGELGLMDDFGSGWAEESSEDLSNEAVSAIKETRRSERFNRIARHQQMKTVKDSEIRPAQERQAVGH